MFHLEFEVLGNQFGLAELIPPSSPPAPVPDVVEPDLGLRTFSQINDTMASLTGIDANQNEVLAAYSELLGSLPPASDLNSFAAAQQIAIQRLATGYCGAVVNNANNCDSFFGEAVGRIVAVIGKRPALRFADVGGGGEVQDRVEGPARQGLAQRRPVPQVAEVKVAADPRQAPASRKIVEDQHFMAQLQQAQHHMGADIAGTAGDEQAPGRQTSVFSRHQDTPCKCGTIARRLPLLRGPFCAVRHDGSKK
jgi:hypothetical protein